MSRLVWKTWASMDPQPEPVTYIYGGSITLSSLKPNFFHFFDLDLDFFFSFGFIKTMAKKTRWSMEMWYNAGSVVIAFFTRSEHEEVMLFFQYFFLNFTYVFFNGIEILNAGSVVIAFFFFRDNNGRECQLRLVFWYFTELKSWM